VNDLKAVMALALRNFRASLMSYNWKTELDKVLGKVLADTDDKRQQIQDARNQLATLKTLGEEAGDDDYTEEEIKELEALADVLDKLVEGADLPEIPEKPVPWREK
jgi:hypothetical protein